MDSPAVESKYYTQKYFISWALPQLKSAFKRAGMFEIFAKLKKKLLKLNKIKKINNSVFCWTQVIQKYESFEMFSTSSSLLCSNSPQSMEGRGHWAQVRSAWRTFSGYISHINLANWRGWVVYLWTHKEPSFRVQLRIRSKRPTGCSLFAQWSQGKIYRTLNCQHFPGNSMLQSRFVSPNGLLLHL